MTGSDISKVLKMIYEALFSPSPNDELYKPSAILPGMIFYYLVTIIVVIVVWSEPHFVYNQLRNFPI
jgi:hypothetical protein